MRDFIYIDDCIDGVLETMDKINDGSALNLSTGKFTSFINLASKACEIVGFNSSIKGLENKPEGVFARGGDINKQKIFGFHFKTNLTEGLNKTINYFDKNI